MLLFVLLIFFQITCIIAQNPIIRTTEGNLIIDVFDKNITLQSGGSINVNQENLIYLISQAKEDTKFIEEFRTVQWNSFTTMLHGLQRDIIGVDGIKSRLNKLELADISRNITLPRTIIPSTRQIRALNRRMYNVERKLRELKTALSTNECKINPCYNGGTCVDGYLSFTCRCPDNWKGDLCQEDVNECAEYAGTDLGCQNGATCINLPGAYQCVCSKDWHGIHCTIKEEVCKAETSQQLCGHGVCVPHKGVIHAYKCICDQGWTQEDSLNPACTKDVNECESGKPHCSVNPLVQCINVPGSFYCGLCPLGYSGNGFYCTDIDECLTDNGGCSQNPKVQCINTLGSRICLSCPPGYAGDGVVCTYEGICHVNNGGCHPQARCISNSAISASYVQCICPPGLTGSGIGPMGCIATSVTTRPLLMHPCSDPNRCNGHGSCDLTPEPPGYICHCAPGFSGRNCEITDDPCLRSPCLNGGTCIRRTTGGFVCRCKPSFTGLLCQRQRQSCGGYLRQESGTLNFPNPPTKYNNNLNCAWVIFSNTSLVINITFTNFNLEPSVSCLFDWLQIHNGETAGDTLIGKYCGNKLPNNGTIISTHNSLYLWFHTDASRVHDGFSLNWTSVMPVCGGTIEIDSHGALSSPGTPGNYPNNRDCEWIITAPISKRIQFHFMTMQIQSHPNCSLDYLAIYDNFHESKSLLRKYCGNIHPEPLVTSTHSARLVFHSDSTISGTGFHMTFITIPGSDCGGILTSTTGEITIPMEKENMYKKGVECEWKIQMPHNERIQLRFEKFEIEKSRLCIHDKLEVYDGSARDAPLIGKYCGKVIPLPIESSGNILYIRFRSDYSLNTGKIVMNYQIRCGGVFSEDTGTIESPLYPNLYPNNRICEYTIQQPVGKVIKLEFQDFQMETLRFTTCRFDYLEIYDGMKTPGKLLGRYCGNRLPPTVISKLNKLILVFVTDFSNARRGFLANYTTLPINCGGVFTNRSGSFQCQPYLNVRMCEWMIVAKEGFVIQVNIRFQSPLGGYSQIFVKDCYTDTFEIYDNNTSTNTHIHLGSFCQTQINVDKVFTSLGNIITIIGRLHFGIIGFTVNYQMIDQRSVCGGKYISKYGVISSPGYPKRYLRNKDCEYIIHIESGQMMLNVDTFDLESSEKCTYDYLEIRNGGTRLSPLIGKFCGRNIPKNIPSMSNQLYLRFVSDYSGSGKGFQISWELSATGCSASLTAPSGEIMSPHYPQPVPANLVCYYRIRVNSGSKIQLIFVDFELATCPFNYFEVHEGFNRNGKLIGKYCENFPLIINSETNSLFIKFQTTESIQGRGFHIKYTIDCNQELTGHRGIIESPNYPESYRPIIECTWKIKAPKGNTLNITFSHFSLNNEESLELWETTYSTKEEEKSQLIKKITKTQKINTNKDIAIIKFKSDNLVNNKNMGFRLEWIVNGCGEEFRSSFGRFTSPGYPKGYPSSLNCLWYITVPPEESIELTIEESFLETGFSCNPNYLDGIKIYSGLTEDSERIALVCHRVKSPITYISSGNEMLIHFYSDASFSGKGFSAHYRTVARKCGGLLTAPHGVLRTRNYPQNYEPKTDCSWLIRIDNNHRIKLEFMDFDLDGEINVNCTDNDYVEVYDGPTRSQNSVRFCGHNLGNLTDVYSTSNTLLVVFHSDEVSSAKGFTAAYTTVCGARIQADRPGQISINNYLNSMRENENCSWIITASDLTDRIVLTVNHVHIGPNNLNNSTNCEFYEVKIHEGESIDGPQLSRFCGTKAPSQIISQGPSMYIEAAGVHVGVFQATYSILGSACGGELTSEEGSFSSPDYPNSYSANEECIWTLKTAPGNRIQLSFDSFNMEVSENCNEDYLEIRKTGPIGQLIGVYCDKQPDVITVDSAIWIKFRSDNDSTTGQGFYANFKMLHGNELNGSRGQIGSPLYPYHYMQSGDFTWRIQVEFGKLIRITFKEFFMGTYSKDDCFSTLSIYDGYDQTANKILKVCGTHLPNPIESKSNVILIELHNILISDGTKFLLEWTEIENDHNELIIKGADCSETIYLPYFNNVSISSPGYPYGYEPSLECIWTVEAPPGFHIKFFIQRLDLEISLDCVYDYIGISQKKRNSNVWSSQLNYCAKNSSIENLELSNFAKIKFVSDMSGNKTGFKGYLYAECGDEIEASQGEIVINETSNLKWESKRKFSFECQYTLIARPGRQIEFHVETINIPSNQGSCDRNYLLIRNGGFIDSNFLGNGKFCGTTPPTDIPVTTSNRAIVIVKGNQGSTLTLKYRELPIECGDTIQLDFYVQNAVNISSPNFPNVPPPYSECIWVIIGPTGEDLRIDFIERFDLLSTFRCTQEMVMLRDGATEDSPLIDTFCNKKPSTQRTKDNHLYIKYMTKVHDPHNGFKATISIDSCGGNYYGPSGIISSSYYPSYTSSNQNCTWNIIAPLGRKVELNIKNYDVDAFGDNPYNCQTDPHLELDEVLFIDNTTNSISPIASFCNKTVNNKIYTTSSNQPRIHLKVKNDKNRINHEPWQFRFRIKFISRYIDCGGGTIYKSSGYITSYNYPNAMLYHHFCHWRLVVPTGRRIKLEVIDVDLYSETDSFIRIYDSWFSSLIGIISKNNHVGEVIYSSGNEMSLSFWAKNLEGHRGFKFKYSSDEATVCDGSLNENEGKIISPNLKYNLTAYACQWTRNQELLANQTLIIKVINMTSNVSDPCSKRPLRVRTRNSWQSFLETLCLNDVFYTSLPDITLMARYRQINLTFAVEYYIKDCGGYLTNPGVITSPGYPNKYPPNMICVWRINFSYEETVRATFNFLELENLCNKDRVVIHNGDHRESPVLGQYCGNTIPVPLNSSSNRMLIEFHSDEANEFKGFSLNIERISKFSECGGLIISEHKYIESPNFPNSYPPSKECFWEIQVEQGFGIRLEFIERFNIESSKNCTADYVEIYEYNDDNPEPIKRLCGRNTPEKIVSSSNKMRIVFRSNSEISGDGFKIKWRKDCNVIIQAKERGNIFSPHYQNNYNLKCNYTLLLPPNTPTQLIAQNFSLVKTDDDLCSLDNLTIYGYQVNWNNKERVQFGPFCGDKIDELPLMIDQIEIIFVSTYYHMKKYFHFAYEQFVCGGTITKPTLIRSSVKTNMNYFSDLRCNWHIEAPPDKIIKLTFKRFDIEFQNECLYDELRIIENNVTRGVFCGDLTKDLPKLTSTTNKLDIAFKTDFSNHIGGFHIKVEFIYGPKSGCGGTLFIKTGETKEIVSLDINKDGFYEPNLLCDWFITTNNESVIQIDILEMDLNQCGNDTECCDYLEFFNGVDISSKQISKFCGTEKGTVISPRNLIHFRFHSDQAARKKGFKISIKAKPNICGSPILEPKDEIQYLTSPNYPESYPDNLYCHWTILQTNKLISINFIDFDLEDDDSCEKDSLKINNLMYYSSMIQRNEPVKAVGPNTDSVSIYCGSKLPPNSYDYANIDVIFQSGAIKSKKHKGFKLSYTITDCAANHTQPSGTINYNYMSIDSAQTKDCVMTIETEKNSTLSVYFHSFALGHDSICENSFLEVREGLKDNSPVILKTCGFMLPDPIFSNGNKLRFLIRSSFSQIIATYISSTYGKGCGGYIRETKGIFTSPLYPSNYRKQKVCSWIIEAPVGLVTAIKFYEFNMGDPTFCNTDFIEIFFVSSNNEEILKSTFCGTEQPALLIGQTNKLIVRQTTSLNNAGNGWKIAFIDVPPGTSEMDVNMKI